MKKRIAAALCAVLILTAVTPAVLMADEEAAAAEVSALVEEDSEEVSALEEADSEEVSAPAEESEPAGAEEIVMPDGLPAEVIVEPAEEAAEEGTEAAEEAQETEESAPELEEEAVEAVEEEELEQASQPSVSYHTHVQTYGWEKEWVKDGAMSGTSGQSKRLEGIEIKVNGVKDLGIRYVTHIQTYGWESAWKENGAMSGTSGESKRLEAIRIELTGGNASKYDIYYCVHAQQFGWLNWAKNGADAGTAGYSYRLEGIKIVILPKGSTAPVQEGRYSAAFYSKSDGPGMNVNAKGVTYNTHVQSYGWQDYISNGAMSGTSGQSKRLEGIHIVLTGQEYSGSIEYRTHIQGIGWQEWKQNGEMSGTSGQSRRLEAIDIRLTGDMASHYDVYYRVHAQNFGWLNWAVNGQSAGTAGYSYRLEGIQIVLVRKGSGAPGDVAGIASAKAEPFYERGVSTMFETDGAYAGIEADMRLTGSGSGCHAKIDIHDRHGVAVSFGIQYEYNLSKQFSHINNNTAFLVENIMSHATQAGHQGKNYYFIQSASLGQNYKVAMSWFSDNSLRFYVDGQEIFRTSTTLTPPLFFQVEGCAMKNGDSVNAQFSNVRVKCGNDSAYYGTWANWNDSDFDFFGLDGRITGAGTNNDNGQWSTNGWPSSGISATVSGTANIGGGADWDTCFSQREPRTGTTGHPLSGIVMIASKEANFR